MTPKFKVWDAEAKEMAQVRYIEFLRDGTCHVGFNGYELIVELEDNLLVQYTGKKDTKGKEIYTGAIVSGKYASHYHSGYDKILGLVDFSDTKLGFVIVDFCMLHELEDIEVIGNIYENPELLRRN